MFKHNRFVPDVTDNVTDLGLMDDILYNLFLLRGTKLFDAINHLYLAQSQLRSVVGWGLRLIDASFMEENRQACFTNHLLPHVLQAEVDAKQYITWKEPVSHGTHIQLPSSRSVVSPLFNAILPLKNLFLAALT